MFNIEKDDMDDLFREAADKYQLDSSGAFDWDKINTALHESDVEKALAVPQLNTSNKNKRKYLLFYLFIFLIFCASLPYYFWGNKIGNTESVNTSVNHQNKNPATSLSENNEQKIRKNDQQKNNASQIGIKSFTETKTISEDLFKDKLKRPRHFFFPEKSAANGSINNNTLPADVVLNHSKSMNNQNNLPGDGVSKPEKKVNIQAEKSSLDAQLKEQKEDTVIGKKTSAAKRLSRFYAGVLASPEFTFIKSQKSESGLTFGVIGGFNINDRWSIETGFFFDKKNYYSKGEYFNKSKVAYLNNLKLISVEGNCNMFEIPLDVRYHFTKDKKSNWSASVGTSSYLMQKENYDYSFTNYGTNGYGRQTYYNSSNNFFATLNVGVGYERKIHNSVSVRIEPYMKLSVKGVGIGSLPMSAAGVNVGVSVPFH